MFYYTRSEDLTMIWEINKILSLPSRPTRNTEKKLRILLEYESTYPNEILRYKYSDIVLQVDSEAAYLTMSGARSCYAGHFYLNDSTSPIPIKSIPKTNVPIDTECKTIRIVVSSAAESEICGTFKHGKTDI